MEWIVKGPFGPMGVEVQLVRGSKSSQSILLEAMVLQTPGSKDKYTLSLAIAEDRKMVVLDLGDLAKATDELLAKLKDGTIKVS